MAVQFLSIYLARLVDKVNKLLHDAVACIVVLVIMIVITRIEEVVYVKVALREGWRTFYELLDLRGDNKGLCERSIRKVIEPDVATSI